jgi:O-antigen/teichoic acid export membrane protein
MPKHNIGSHVVSVVDRFSSFTDATLIELTLTSLLFPDANGEIFTADSLPPKMMGDDGVGDRDDISDALSSIGLSAVFLLAGSIFGKMFGFGSRIVVTRYLPVDGYGNVVIGVTLASILGLLAMPGLDEAVTRFLPRTDDTGEQREIVASAFRIATVLSVLFGTLSFLTADLIASFVFDSPGLSPIIQVFSVGLPFYVLYQLYISGFQGQLSTGPTVAVRELLLPGSRLAFIAVFAFAGFGVFGIAVSYNLAYIIAAIVALYIFLGTEFSLKQLLTTPVSRSRYREMLTFSLPLVVTGSLGIITRQSDLLLIGIFKNSTSVGIYDIVYVLAQFLMFFSTALNYLFKPLISRLDSQDKIGEMNRIYTIVTRWDVMLSFPIFVLIVAFPTQTLGTLFGKSYVDGTLALTLLAVGYYGAKIAGMAGSFLICVGKTKILMQLSIATSVLNIGLNILLIPQYGIVGAAIATGTARLLNNFAQVTYMFLKVDVHPVKRELFSPTIIALTLLVLVSQSGVESFVDFTGAFLIAAALGVTFLLGVLLTRSVYKVELQLLEALLERVGVSTTIVGRLAFFTRNTADR